MAAPRSRLVVPNFASEGRALRREFEDVYSSAGEARPERFRWDLFHVEGQYSHLRTPAYAFFSPKLYRHFHERLVQWGRRTLGCHDVSPTWLSLYVDGCEQRLHADVPHGPWAFVYSLTPRPGRDFEGGETLFLTESTLRFWENFAAGDRFEEDRLLDAVPSRFGQLLVFDGRVPHGVRQVRGSRDPLKGRLVLHGWFLEPRPFIEGPHRRDSVTKVVERLSGAIEDTLAQDERRLHGTISVRLRLNASGKAGEAKLLASSLKDLDGRETARFEREILGFLGSENYGRARGSSHLTLPLMFR